MLIPVPTPPGLEYDIRLWASVIKSVTCEGCGTEYVYELRRMGAGQGFAPFFLGARGARARAQYGAAEEVSSRLAEEVDLVACPRCGGLQTPMLRAWRKAYIKLVVLLWAIAEFGFFWYWLICRGLDKPTPMWVTLGAIAATLGAIGWIVRICRNVTPPCHPQRAMLREEAERLGYGRLSLPRVDQHGWMSIRPSLLSLPALCGCCAAPSEVAMRRPLSFLAVAIPVCRRCRRRIVLKRLALAAATFVGGMLGLGVLLTSLTRLEWAESLCLGVFVGAFLLAIVANWPLRRAGLPVHLRRIRPLRDEAEIRFHNHAVAEAYLAQELQRVGAEAAPQTASPVPI